ncbi:MAG: GntR family transcriptional regulator [Eubacteriales bacterium]|nr:GntR family transcriptional regulator [Eubacteriales bacterium]
MVSFAGLVLEDGTAIYLQIILFIKRAIVAGLISDGDELPSRRYLSTLLGVNPNTVQKAYRMLEEEGLMQSHTGARSYVLLNDLVKEKVRSELIEEAARSVVNSMKQMGIDKSEALKLIDRFWD